MLEVNRAEDCPAASGVPRAGLRIGCHLSASGGYLAMAQTAVSIGANVFQDCAMLRSF